MFTALAYAIFVLLVVGVLWYVVQSIPVLEPWIKNVIRALLVLAVLFWLFQFFFGFPGYPAHHRW